MTPWLEDPDVRLYHGDCLDVLRQLPSSSVHMCATSPPFYGLRDYGTGLWEGGNPDCDHLQNNYDRGVLQEGTEGSGPSKATAEMRRTPYKQGCGKCGAHRVDQQIGLEDTPDQWVERLVAVFREVRRVLRDDGTLWVEIGDSYAHPAMGGTAGSSPDGPRGGRLTEAGRSPSTMGPGLKQKDLLGQPWLLAFALRADGWYLRSEIIWARPNPMPESVTDRPTKSHSTVFLLSKQPKYFYDADAIRVPYIKDGRTVTTVKGTDASHQHRNGERWPNETGANARSVWQIPTQPTPFAHFATWPEALVRRMILAGTSERGCCPECGAPWTRDVETTDERVGEDRGGNYGGIAKTDGTKVMLGGYKPGSRYVTIDHGWRGECTHALPPVPCAVLDPFAGSATTMLVARNHGRHSIGIELNADYLEIAARRLQQLTLLA